MAITTENLLLACAVVAGLLLVAVGIGLWRLAAHRRAIRLMTEESHQQALQLQALETQRSGLQQRMADKDAFTDNLRQSHERELAQLKVERKDLDLRHEEKRAALQEDLAPGFGQ